MKLLLLLTLPISGLAIPLNANTTKTTSLPNFNTTIKTSNSPTTDFHLHLTKDEVITDELLFHVPITTFIAARTHHTPPALDWSSDGCTHSPEHILTWKFTPSCNRHDFGYGNYKRQHRFDAASKSRIDWKFYGDLVDECRRHFWTGLPCRVAAVVYYEAVKHFG